MSRPTWILVADGSRARLFEQERPDDGAMVQVQSWANPALRVRAESLAYGNLGRASKGHPGSVSFEPRTSLKQREHDRFAHELAQHLADGVRGGRCGALVLVASNSMLGAIRHALPAPAARLVQWSASVDLTRFEGRELRTRLDALRPPLQPAPEVWPPAPVAVETPAARSAADLGP
jgi:protein required for attachment to host cells